MTKIANRIETLAAINSELAARGLKPIRKLGDNTKGEIEIVSLKEVYDHSARFFTDVKFAVLFPGGKEGEFTVRFNAGGGVADGAVVVTVINGRFAVVKQWRVPLSRWTYELPRGFGDRLSKAAQGGTLADIAISDLPLAIVERELGEQVMKGAKMLHVSQLGEIAENSGTCNVAPAYYLVEIKVDDELLASKLSETNNLCKVELWSGVRMRAELGEKICDSHSIVGLALSKRFIASI